MLARLGARGPTASEPGLEMAESGFWTLMECLYSEEK